MATKTQIEARTATTAPETKSLEEIVNRVEHDSRDEPQAYLEETKVPHGGE